MLGVLAISGVLSIGGIALYRRAVNNHHANTILDDINRFAFAIIEKGNYPLGEGLPKGDFKESGIYSLTAHQAAGAGQFSILVSNVPKGVCEPLVDKGIVDYKVGVVTAGGSVDDEILYDTLHKDICNNDVNDVAFYFGDTSLVCNPKENGYTPCTVNSDCCGNYFCAFQNASSGSIKGNGECQKVDDFEPQTVTITVNGISQTWIRSTNMMTWFSADNFCQTYGKRMATIEDINYKETTPHSDIWPLLREAGQGDGWHLYLWYWTGSEAPSNRCVNSFYQTDSNGRLTCYGRYYKTRALCR